ncbi:MAG TPA: undecaprenyl-diphosphate phosphatase [Terriglobales bacterium]|nr:undecaprenyl-diphosphate phosphatase [Terriglobales bacterium]
MDCIKVVLLGIVQGLTEFLPVSSSGHLVLAEKIFNLHSEHIYLEVFLHFGTFMAVLIIFRKDIYGIIKALWNKIFRRQEATTSVNYIHLFFCLFISTIPAVILGLLFKDYVENAFTSSQIVSVMLIFTGIFLFLTKFSRVKKESVGLLDSLIIGIAQGLALLPGISRSGWTIGTGLFRGIKGSKAAEFSFLLSLPVILGASLLKMKEGLSQKIPLETVELYCLGALFAFVFGFLSIKFLLRIIKKGKLEYFGYYCIIVGILSLILLK